MTTKTPIVLPDLNSTRFFCKRCGIGRDGDCPACDKPTAIQFVDEDDREFPLIVYLLFAAGLLIVAVGAWFVSKV